MKKHELIKALEIFDDNAEVYIRESDTSQFNHYPIEKVYITNLPMRETPGGKIEAKISTIVLSDEI